MTFVLWSCFAVVVAQVAYFVACQIIAAWWWLSKRFGIWVVAKGATDIAEISAYNLKHGVWFERQVGPLHRGFWYRERQGKALLGRWFGLGRYGGLGITVGRTETLYVVRLPRLELSDDFKRRMGE